MAKIPRTMGIKDWLYSSCCGSTVGLGNIWRFSYVAGNEEARLCSDLSRSNFFFGYPLLCTEIAIGRTTQKSSRCL